MVSNCQEIFLPFIIKYISYASGLILFTVQLNCTSVLAATAVGRPVITMSSCVGGTVKVNIHTYFTKHKSDKNRKDHFCLLCNSLELICAEYKCIIKVHKCTISVVLGKGLSV